MLEKLIRIIREKSYKEGDFTLASGKKSSFYLDVKETSLSQEGILLIGQLGLEKIKKEKLNVYAVGGMTLGADPISVAISYAAALENIPLQSFIVRKEPKGHGTGAWLEGTKNFPKGAPVLVIEDVVTSGGSAMKAIKVIQEAGFEVKGLLTIVDREEGGAELFASNKIPFFSLCRLREVREKKINL